MQVIGRHLGRQRHVAPVFIVPAGLGAEAKGGAVIFAGSDQARRAADIGTGHGIIADGIGGLSADIGTISDVVIGVERGLVRIDLGFRIIGVVGCDIGLCVAKRRADNPVLRDHLAVDTRGKAGSVGIEAVNTIARVLRGGGTENLAPCLQPVRDITRDHTGLLDLAIAQRRKTRIGDTGCCRDSVHARRNRAPINAGRRGFERFFQRRHR